MSAAEVRRPARRGRTDPLSRDVLFRQVGALVGVVLLGFLSMSIRQVSQAKAGTVVTASTLTVATVAAAILVPWHRVPAWIHRVLPFVFLCATYLTTRATGGPGSDYAQLAFLPVLWVATYGGTSEVFATIGGAAIVLALPLVGGTPTEQEWLRVFTLICAGSALGFVVHRFFSGIRHQTSRLRFLAGTDPLTGAANRRAWDEELAGAIVRADRDGWSLSVAFVDLDDFKGYNDRYGHQTGDLLLKEVAAAWQATLRAGDVLARIGGDEFGVLLPGCGREMATTIAERLRAAVDAVRCSVGVATWDGSETAERLLARTDAALYEAKEQGRDRVVVVLATSRSSEEGPGLIIPDPVFPASEPPGPAAA